MHCLPPASLSVLPYAHEAFACLLAYDIHPRRQSFPRRNAQGDSAWIVLLSRRVWKSPASGISSPLRSVDIRLKASTSTCLLWLAPCTSLCAVSLHPSHYKAGALAIGSPLRYMYGLITVHFCLWSEPIPHCVAVLASHVGLNTACCRVCVCA